jgi:predicted NUDIX family phosphoesterase
LDKFEKEIMVVDRATLFAEGYFQGFAPAAAANYQDVILDNYFYIKRGEAEVKPEFKQPIAYCIILNRETNKVFAYQRSAKKENYAEKRLRGKWSWGIGGHIDKIDTENGNPIEASMLREIEEEIHIKDFAPIKVLGYINDDETEVGEVHFGVLYLIETTSRVKPKDEEIAFGEFTPIDQLQEFCDDEDASVESWSEIALPALREYLGLNDEE